MANASTFLRAGNMIDYFHSAQSPKSVVRRGVALGFESRLDR